MMLRHSWSEPCLRPPPGASQLVSSMFPQRRLKFLVRQVAEHESTISMSPAHAPEMKQEQKQEQVVTPQLEIASQQEQSFDIGLSL